MKPGDIVLIRFPQTDLVIGKLRPALIIAMTPGHHADALLALISSRTHQSVSQFDEIIDPTDDDYAESGVKVRSVIRVARLATVETAIINARLGSISTNRLNRIKERLIVWLKTN